MKLRFTKTEHLRHPAEFRRVYDRRCSVSAEWLTVYGCPNDLGNARVGFSVSRKIGNAVKRNHFRRLYREAFRLTREHLPTGLDFVLIPRNAREPELEKLKETLIILTKELARRLLRGKQSI